MLSWRKVGIFVVSLALFILALELMKAGAGALSYLVHDLLRVSNLANGLGFGWLSAYAVMSGSPVAAASLTLFDGGVVSEVTAFAMITGSRLGASIVVLLIGIIYVLRGHERTASMTTGLLSLVVTATVYLPALPLGLALISSRTINGDLITSQGGDLVSVIDLVFGTPVTLLSRMLPEWAVFLVGLGVIVGSLNLFDRALPELKLQESAFSGVPRVLYRPIVVFALGFGITLLTLSVSVSLGLLVPLSARGYIRRENLVPYIMGCNISTFVDTLAAGLLLRNPAASGIVLAEMFSILIISAIILVFFFGTYERAILRFVVWVTESRRRLLFFLALIVLTPIGLLLVR